MIVFKKGGVCAELKIIYILAYPKSIAPALDVQPLLDLGRLGEAVVVISARVFLRDVLVAWVSQEYGQRDQLPAGVRGTTEGRVAATE